MASYIFPWILTKHRMSDLSKQTFSHMLLDILDLGGIVAECWLSSLFFVCSNWISVLSQTHPQIWFTFCISSIFLCLFVRWDNRKNLLLLKSKGKKRGHDTIDQYNFVNIYQVISWISGHFSEIQNRVILLINEFS